MKTANFLSGGQSLSDASGRLNAMNKLKTAKDPWNLSFSWSAALQVTRSQIPVASVGSHAAPCVSPKSTDYTRAGRTWAR